MPRPKFNTYETDQIEAILYYQFRIAKCWEELLQTRDKKAIWHKLGKVRESRKLC